MCVSGYNHTWPELERRDHTYSTMYGKCMVTTTQLDIFLCCKVITKAILRLSKSDIFSELLCFMWEEPCLPYPPLVLGPVNPPSGNPHYRAWDGDEKYAPDTNLNIIWIHSAHNWLMYGKPHIYWSNLLGPT